MDFFYRGEANVFQENLDSFPAIVEELKGFMGNKDERVEDLAVDEKRPPPQHLSAFNKEIELPKISLNTRVPQLKTQKPGNFSNETLSP